MSSVPQITASQVKPLVSIGMPVFNCEKTVAHAIASILNQTVSDWELLIIDDGSTDRTLEVIKAFKDRRIVVIEGSENRRLPARLNECVRRSNGEFFARMDGDDVAYPSRLEHQLQFLRDHPEIDLVAGWIVVFRDDGIVLGARRGYATHEQMWVRPWRGVLMPHSTWLGRLEWFKRNPYHPVRASEDQELLLRTYQMSRFATVQEIVLGYREDRLPLSYILRQRRHLCEHILRNAIREGNILSVALGALDGAAKGLVETVAICAQLNHRVLRRRAMPVIAEEAEKWRLVWRNVKDCTGMNGKAGSSVGSLCGS